MANKYKVQLSAPNTCELTPIVFNWTDPIEGPKVETKFFGCVYLETYDVLLPPGSRVVFIAALLKVCTAHDTGAPVATGKLLWHDGNWKSLDRYIKYQQDWFLWLNVQQWEARKAAGIIDVNEPLMEELLPFRTEPATPGSVTAPPAGEITDLGRIYDWAVENNARLGVTYEIIETETLERDTQALATHAWTLTRDSRLLTLNPNQGLNAAATSRIQADCDVQFGAGKVVIES